MNATVCVQITHHLTHTRALFLAAHATCVTRLAQGADDSLCVWKSHFIIGHVFVECSFDPVSSYLVIAYYHTDTTDWNQTKPVRDSTLPVERLVIWPIRLQTQVLSPSSASMSVASTRRSTFRPETWFSSKSTTRRPSLLPRTSIYLDILEHQAAASTRQQAQFPLCWNWVHWD